MSKSLVSFGIGLGTLATVATMAHAAALTIDDTSPNEVLTYSANDWEFGLALNGVLFQQGLSNPNAVTVPETDVPDQLMGTWITNGLQGPAFGSIYLVEALGPDPAGLPLPISDIFQYEIIPNADGTATLFASFVSADNLGFVPSGIDPNSVYYEDGHAVTLEFYALSVSIASDAVPAPGPMAGMIMVGGFAAIRRRRA